VEFEASGVDEVLDKSSDGLAALEAAMRRLALAQSEP
jgi:hypothetical protein